ncbi:MAG: hypothetical protein CO189_07500 [candidate division Zixibacteria bacterium CG_4_9_14_3_um_filter_46_8]|nr:MAG: hypothetical protein CO189_07500 [candidate division Zixibacteria bacterium CG_4_9_14_3_um_filter_46_8]
MKFKTVTILVIGLMIVSALPAIAQDINFNFVGSGARARGMGGAFISVADDATAISWNPAGLATLEKPEGSVVGYYTSSKYTLDIGDISRDYSESHLAFNFGSVAYPLQASGKNVVIAGAYQRLVDLYWKNEGTDMIGDYTEEVKGGIDAISPGAAIQITPEIAVGAAFNIWTGGIDYTLDYPDSPDNNTDEPNVDKFSGFNVNIGALAQFQKIKLGAVVKTPLSITDKYEFGSDTYKDKIKFPMTYGFGASFAPNENLTLAADVDIRPYSNTDWEDDQNDTTYSMNFDNTTQFRVGMEYLFVGEKTIFPVRLGFHTEPLLKNPLYTMDENTGEEFDTEKVTGKYFSGGFGVIFGNIWVDAAYEYGSLKVDGEANGPSDGVTYKEQVHNVILSAIVHFD